VERVKKDWEAWLSRNRPDLHADVVEHLDSLLSDLRMAVEADASQQGECAKCGADMESRSWRCVECGYIDRAAFRQGVDYKAVGQAINEARDAERKARLEEEYEERGLSERQGVDYGEGE
jgi:hypothetical protein